MVRLVVRFSVTDDQGRAVASREHQLSGASRFDHKGAREAAVTALANTLRRSTSLAPFGFKD
jgi:predicted HD phosphohydrolase